MIVFLWNCVVSAIAILGASKLVDGVKCRSFGDAFKVSLLYSLIFAVLWSIAVRFGAIALVLSLLVPVLGQVAWFAMMLVTAFLICCVSLYTADQLVDGFELDSFGTTVLTAFVIGLLNLPLRLLLH